eukprot:2526185-Prymnesium_polylepis.1
MPHIGQLPPADTRDKKVGEEHALARQRRDGRLQLRAVHVLAHPRPERLNCLEMRLNRLQPVSIVCVERSVERWCRQPREAHVLVYAHRVRVVAKRTKPQHRHEMALPVGVGGQRISRVSQSDACLHVSPCAGSPRHTRAGRPAARPGAAALEYHFGSRRAHAHLRTAVGVCERKRRNLNSEHVDKNVRARASLLSGAPKMFARSDKGVRTCRAAAAAERREGRCPRGRQHH